MRGSRFAERYADDDSGIIPAHAGLTAGSGSSTPFERDHPRACGAHWMISSSSSTSLGSSPRMRGSREDEDIVTSEEGIIPAHAGLT